MANDDGANHVIREPNVVYAACDGTYLRDYGLVLIDSCVRHGQRVHLTTDDVDSDTMRRLLPRAENDLVTFDLYDVPHHRDRGFYCVLRLVRLREVLDAFERVLMIDVDAILNRPIDWNDFDRSVHVAYHRKANGRDWIDGRMVDTGEGVTLCHGFANFVRADEYGYRFADRAVGIVDEMNYVWGSDVMAISKASQEIDDRHVGEIDPDLYHDINFQEGSVLWTAKSNKKTDPVFLRKQFTFLNDEADLELLEGFIDQRLEKHPVNR